MSTSLADLLQALDESSRVEELTPDDSAAALAHAGRAMLTVASHLDTRSKDRYQQTVRRAALLGCEVGTAWPAERGRCAQLAGVVEDALGLHVAELDHADLKVATEMLTASIRRFAICIQDNSASFAPLLDDLIATSDDLRRRHAAHPASGRSCTALFQPYALASVPGGMAPGQTVAESVDGIADYLSHVGRSPLTVRQIIAVCRIAEVVADRVEEATGERGRCDAARWRKLRGQVALLVDGLHEAGYAGNGRIMVHALTADRALAAMTSAEIRGDADVSRSAGKLILIAPLIQHELRRIQPSLLVPKGARPLSSRTAGHWLTGTTFQPRLRDLEPIFQTIDRIQCRSSDDVDVTPPLMPASTNV